MPCEARVGSSVGLPRPNVHISYVIFSNQPVFELQVDYINTNEGVEKINDTSTSNPQVLLVTKKDKSENDGTHNLHLCAPAIWYTFY